MRAKHDRLVRWATGAAATVNLGLGCATLQPWVAAGGALGLAYVVARRRAACPAEDGPPDAAQGPAPSPPRRPRRIRRETPIDPSDTEALVEDMLAQGRYALLLRRQIAGNLSETQFRAAIQALEEDMALVPDGDVMLGPVDEPPDGLRFDEVERDASQGRIIQVARFFLDRYPVTNAQYAAFVAAGGYEQAALWDPTILPAVLDFVDRTGRPGPRFWNDGTYLPGQEDHPVVGVSWYEAAAYARWVGKRLPTDAEWVKAASWPVNLSATTRLQRRYPWGDTMDRSRANLWGSGPKATVPVHEYASGASVGGVYQLVGNVWEWMRGNFTPPDLAESQWAAEMGLKSIRGGAYDTYFDHQATCQFQSGEAAGSQKHNIGFRCAVSVCDLALAPPGSASASDAADAAPPEVPQ